MFVMCVCACVRVCGFCDVWMCVCVGVLVICVLVQGGSNMTGTDLYVNKPHCAAAVRP